MTPTITLNSGTEMPIIGLGTWQLTGWQAADGVRHAFELGYQLYDGRFAGRGYVTEAVRLLVDYLFAAKKQHRIQLVIGPWVSTRNSMVPAFR